MKTSIDYTQLREATVLLNSFNAPNLDFDINWKFYYDETNNFKKLHIKDRDDFNIDVQNNFVLGGLCHDKSEIIDENLIFSNIELQKTINEVKFKHIASGTFLDILKSKKLNTFLKNIEKLPLYLHYQSFNPLYYSLVDIIDSLISKEDDNKFISNNRTLKATIYDVLKNNIEKTKDIIKKYGYPNIENDNVQPFILDLISLVEQDLENSTFYMEKVRLNFLLELLENSKGREELVFLSDEDEHILVKQLNEIYAQNVTMFINSEHIFDNESDVQENFSEIEMTCQDKIIDNFSFMDSKSSIFVQASDVIIGALGKFFSFIRTLDISTLDHVVSELEEIQLENLDLLLNLYNKSLQKNSSFINSIESDSELVKLNKINTIRGFA